MIAHKQIAPAVLVLCLLSAGRVLGQEPSGWMSQLADVQNFSLRGDGVALSSRLKDIERDSGIEFRIPADFAADTLGLGTRTWIGADAVGEALRGYNYAAVWGDDGRLKRLFVRGRSGVSGVQSSHAQPASNRSQRDLVVYDAEAAGRPLPEKFRALKSGSVIPIMSPIEKLTRMKLGDKATLGLPIGQFEVVHDNALRHENGDSSWVGYLATEGKAFRVIITHGEGGTVTGQINTPNGVFKIEQAGAQAWLVDMSATGLSSAATLDNDQRHVPADPEPRAPIPAASASVDNPATVDLLVLYTPGLNEGAPLTRINHLLALTQQSYLDSEIFVNLRLVHAQAVDYPEGTANSAALDDLTFNRLSPDIAGLRNQYGADLVALLRPLQAAAQANCGVAWVGGANNQPLVPEAGFAVVSDGYDDRYFCHEYTFAHELGHTFGNVHDESVSPQGIFPFSYAWGVVGQFVTIMSYMIDAAPLVGKFANPRITCTASGLSCGDPAVADNARTTNLTAPSIADYRPTALH